MLSNIRNCFYRSILVLLLLVSMTEPLSAKSMTLTLERTIELAGDSSLTAFRYRNMYQASYWQYISYRASRLPSLSLQFSPASYHRYMTRRYDSEQNIDIFRQQLTFGAGASLQMAQNFDLFGGVFYLESGMEFMRNFGANRLTQYSAVPVRLGYRQSLIGFNSFKWERKIEPLKFEKAKKELVYNLELVSEQAVTHFFTLALAQAEYRLAEENVASCDSLYAMGEKRFRIASISRSELLTLKLDKVNARNSLENCRIALKRAMFSLASFLGMDKNTEIETEIPECPAILDIQADLAIMLAKENNPDLLGHRQTILEGERELSRAKMEARFNASVNASVGFNQVSDNLSGAYRDPLRQDIVALQVSVPLIDWGVRKGKINMARNNLNVMHIAAGQQELSVEEDIVMTLNDYAVRQRLISSAKEAQDLADLAYGQTMQRFMIGKADLNSITLSLNRKQEALKNYISALQNFWLSHYKIRRLTLYDFVRNEALSTAIDSKLLR